MVEMRWVNKIQSWIEDDEKLSKKVKVLQYRYHSPTVDASGSLTPFGSWSEWIDVPTVTDPTV